MSIWKYLGGAAGGVGGFFAGGPVGAVAGASAGYGLGGMIDASNASSDAAQQAQDAANGVTTPQIDPNAGIGSGYGGITPQEQSMFGGDIAKGNAIDQQITALAQQYKPIDPNDPGSIGQQMQIKAQIDALQTQKQQLKLPDMSDPGRYAAQAQASYNRQAPQVSMVAPNMGNYNADRSMFSQGGNAMYGQLARMNTDTVANGQGQQQLVDRLNSDMNGGQPSLAQAQLNQSTDANIQQQRAMAATAGPMDYAAAQRAAIMGGANAQQQALGQGAVLRAQEYAQARGELGGALANQRGQTLQNLGMQNDMLVNKRAQELQAMGVDSQTATQQAQLEAQQHLNNANLQAGQNQLNQGREMGYLGAYQDTRHMQQGNTQFNATSNLNAQNIKAGLQGGAVNAQMQDAASQRAMAGSMISAGATMGAGYMQSHPSASAPATQPYGGQSQSSFYGLGYGNPDAGGIVDPWKT